jgi:hypothetical protein
MNSDFDDSMDASLLRLERELQSLTPAPPRREFVRELHARMESGPPALSSSSTSNKVHAFPWRRVVTPAAAAAAAVAVMSIQSGRRATAGGSGKSVAEGGGNETAAINWTPMPMRSEYRALLDAGFVLNEDFEPVQQFLLDRVDHHEWRNPANNESIRLTIPRQDRFVVPAGYESRGLRFQ